MGFNAETTSSSMSVTVRIEGLPDWVTGAHLKDVCSQYGPVVSSRVVKNPARPHSGFGFIEMCKYEAVEAMLTALHDSFEHPLFGYTQKIFITWATSPCRSISQ
jgi:RNA recognition motif-containing protein